MTWHAPGRPLAALGAAGLLLAVAASPASAGGPASVDTFTFTSTETFDGAIPECFSADLVGTNVATETVTGQSVVTSSGVTQVRATVVFSYRVDFANGMYSLGKSTSHFSFLATDGVGEFTQVGTEPRTIYAADGTPVAHAMLHAGNHVTFQDLNGDGAAQEGEISAEWDFFFFTCH